MEGSPEHVYLENNTIVYSKNTKTTNWNNVADHPSKHAYICFDDQYKVCSWKVPYIFFCNATFNFDSDLILSCTVW